MGILGDIARRDLSGGTKTEDEQVDGLDREDAKIIADKHPVFTEVNPDGTQSSVQRDEPMKVCEICIRLLYTCFVKHLGSYKLSISI